MSQQILVIGESGTGKSSSIENLDYNETFIIKVTDKPLPFKATNKKYIVFKHNEQDINKSSGNMYVLKENDKYSKSDKLLKIIDFINKDYLHIKNVVIDDYQYLIIDEFLSKATEKGYEKFSILAKNMYSILNKISSCRDDLTFIILSHSDIDNDKISSMQCVGKLIRDKIKPEGKFTVVLHTVVNEGKYNFLTQFRTINGIQMMAKSPKGMFSDDLIPNDMNFVLDKMHSYYNQDIEM